MFKRIDHVEIVAGDLERSIRFYCDVFGFRLRQRHEVDFPPLREIAYLDLGDTTLELMAVDQPQPPETEGWQVGYRMMAIEVDDLDAALAALAKDGIEPSWGPVTLGSSKRAEVQDPDGLPIELRQW